MVRVLIEDHRPMFAGLPPTKSIEVMELGVIDATHSPTTWCVSANELLVSLQGSLAAIEGASLGFSQSTALLTQV